MVSLKDLVELVRDTPKPLAKVAVVGISCVLVAALLTLFASGWFHGLRVEATVVLFAVVLALLLLVVGGILLAVLSRKARTRTGDAAKDGTDGEAGGDAEDRGSSDRGRGGRGKKRRRR